MWRIIIESDRGVDIPQLFGLTDLITKLWSSTFSRVQDKIRVFGMQTQDEDQVKGLTLSRNKDLKNLSGNYSSIMIDQSQGYRKIPKKYYVQSKLWDLHHNQYHHCQQ